MCPLQQAPLIGGFSGPESTVVQNHQKENSRNEQVVTFQ